MTTYDYVQSRQPKSFLNVADGLRMVRQPIDFIYPGFKARSAGVLFAQGGTGKSFLALELAIAVANNQADIAGFQPKGEGQVLYVNAEDDEEELCNRLSWIGERIHPSLDEKIARNLQIEPAMGIFKDFGWRSTDGCVSEELMSLAEYARGYRLIILDTLNRFHHLNENDNGQMSQFIGNLEFVVRLTGAAVLFMHHTNKTAIRNGDGDSQAAARGADAIISNVRHAAFLSKMTIDEAKSYGIDPERKDFFLRFGIAKQNSGLPLPDRWLERKEGGVLLPVELLKAKQPIKERNRARENRL
jgi:RecA-family ATPase